MIDTEKLRRTRVESGRDRIEHVGVHVRVDGPVGGSVVASGYEDRVTLCDSDGDQVDRGLFDVSLPKKRREKPHIVSKCIQKR